MARTTIPAELVAINAIQGTLIADNAITAVHIATNAVSGTLVADNAITSTHIAQNNVTATQIAQNTITVTQMADSAIETAKINNDAVTQAKIADDAVGPDQLAANAVVSASIANGTIVEADMADNAVTLAKMASLARGSIIVGDSAGDPAALSIGSNGTVLKSDGTDVSWGTVSAGVAGISTSADATAITIDSSERVMIGSTTSAISANAQKLQISNAGATSVYHSSVMLHSQQNDGNANVNRISWSGGDGASATRVFSSIEGGKENSTSGEYGGMISMSTRPHGGTQTERMRISSTGIMSVPNGIELGSGLDATAANILDDYEEGTWTPAFYTSGGVTTTTTTTNYGIYTKIGRMVYIHAKLHVTLSSLPGQIVTVTGLPFTGQSATTDTGQRAIFAIGGDASNLGGNAGGSRTAHFRLNNDQLQGVYMNSGTTAYWYYNHMDSTTFDMNIHGHYAAQ